MNHYKQDKFWVMLFQYLIKNYICNIELDVLNSVFKKILLFFSPFIFVDFTGFSASVFFKLSPFWVQIMHNFMHKKWARQNFSGPASLFPFHFKRYRSTSIHTQAFFICQFPSYVNVPTYAKLPKFQDSVAVLISEYPGKSQPFINSYMTFINQMPCWRHYA